MSESVIAGLLKQNIDLVKEIQKLQEEKRGLVEALESQRYSDGCFCEVSIGNPMMRGHSEKCKIAREALAGVEG